jgi:hypothetical protein
MAKLHEAQANMAYYGFKRVPERDFSDDGTRFFMWVWDPEDTGHSPFYFSKAGGYDMVFFSEHFGSNVRQECRRHGYNNLDDLNGISKSAFTDEALGKIVAQLQAIRESDWFESLCPEFSTRGAIDQGIEVKDYNADKDHQRVMDFAKRAGGDTDKMIKLAANMAKAIKDEEKMRSRWQAAVDIYGSESPVAKAFEAQANANHWHINIRPRSGDIDWSSLFESTIRENVGLSESELVDDSNEEDWDDLGYDDPDAGVEDLEETPHFPIGGHDFYYSDADKYEPSYEYYSNEEMAADGFQPTGIKTDDDDNLKDKVNLTPPQARDIFVNPTSLNTTLRKTKDVELYKNKLSHSAFNDDDRYRSDTGEYRSSADKNNEDLNERPSDFHFDRKDFLNIFEEPMEFGPTFNRHDSDPLNVPDSYSIGYPEAVDYTPEDVLKDSKKLATAVKESKKIKESMDKPFDILIAKKESEKGKSIEDKWRYADKVQISLDRVNDSHLYKVSPISNGAVLYYWNENGSINNINEDELLMAVERFTQGYKDFDIEIADKKLLPILSKGQSDFINKKLFGLAERKYWNNFFDKLTESADGNRTEDLLKDYFDTTDVELSDETCWGLPVYIVDNKRYAVGDADDAYEAAVKQAISVYEDDTDEGKINWLQKHHWPGVDEEGVCEACGDDLDDYGEGETIYQPSSIDEYIDTMGFSQASDAFSMAFLGDYINKQEIGEYVVDNDGVGALASEDGNEISIGDDLYAYCLGGAY